MASSNTSSATSTSSAIKVFHTVELMEMILLEEDIHDLFVQQRVCKAWFGTIKGSLKLQQKMFLLPSAPLLRPTKFDSPAWNPRHLYRGQCIALNPCASVDRVHRRYDQSGKRITSSKRSLLRICVEANRNQNLITFSFYPLSSPDRDGAPTRGVHHPTASWRRMFISQPPLMTVDVRQQSMRFGAHQSNLVALWNKDGITFGDVYDGKPHFRIPRLKELLGAQYCVDAAFLRSSAWPQHSADLEQMHETEDEALWWGAFKKCKGQRFGRGKDALCKCLSLLLHGRDIPEPQKKPSLRRRIGQTMPWGRKR